MRLLFISSNNFPEDWSIYFNGTRKRQQVFFDAIKDITEIDLLYYVPPDIEISHATITQREQELCQHLNTKVNLFLCHQWTYPQSLPKWKKHGYGIFNFFKQYLYVSTGSSAQIRVFETCLDREPDIIFVHRLTSMPPLMLTRKSLPPIFFDLDDIEHLRFLRQLKESRRLEQIGYSLQLPARFWGEYKAICLANKTFVCSEMDKKYLNKQLRFHNIEIVPNVVSIPELQDIASEPILLLLGTYESSANVKAANFLVEQVWPTIHQKIPQAKLLLAGKNPENIRSYGKGISGIEFTGFVNDLDGLYRRARVVCCPIFAGAGTRVKMVEAAAYGKPIVATRIGAEGLNMSDGEEFLLRDRPQEFARACLELIRNDNLCQQLGSKARKAAIRYYDRDNVIQLIQKYIQQTIKLTNSSQKYIYSSQEYPL